jgi:hypothetical protein
MKLKNFGGCFIQSLFSHLALALVTNQGISNKRQQFCGVYTYCRIGATSNRIAFEKSFDHAVAGCLKVGGGIKAKQERV